MSIAQEKQRCRAVAGTSAERCKRRKLFRSRYCWHHQPWGTNLVALMLGTLSGFAINVASNRLTERAPELEVYLNWQHLAEDTVFVYPTNAHPFEFTFWIHNVGDLAADEMFVRLATHSYSTNFVHGPKWLYEEVGSFAYTDPFLAGMVQ